MTRVRTLLAADADIEHALVYTLRTYGRRKYDEYSALIREALEALATAPEAGRNRPDINPDAWTVHIAKPGRAARHLLLYRIVNQPPRESHC